MHQLDERRGPRRQTRRSLTPGQAARRWEGERGDQINIRGLPSGGQPRPASEAALDCSERLRGTGHDGHAPPRPRPAPIVTAMPVSPYNRPTSLAGAAWRRLGLTGFCDAQSMSPCEPRLQVWSCGRSHSHQRVRWMFVHHGFVWPSSNPRCPAGRSLDAPFDASPTPICPLLSRRRCST